jgi:hypothetical protein
MTAVIPQPGTPITLEHLALILSEARNGVEVIAAPSDAGLSMALTYATEECVRLAAESDPDRLDPMPGWWTRWTELTNRLA